MNKNKIKAVMQKSLKRAWLARLTAKLIDLFVFALLTCVLFPMGFLLGIIYLAIGDSLGNGQSLGKRIIGMKVILVEDNSCCDLKASAVRNLPLIAPLLLLVVPVLGWILGGALLVIFVTIEIYLMVTLKSTQRLGDMMAETTVVVIDHKPVDSTNKRTSWFEASVASTCEN